MVCSFIRLPISLIIEIGLFFYQTVYVFDYCPSVISDINRLIKEQTNLNNQRYEQSDKGTNQPYVIKDIGSLIKQQTNLNNQRYRQSNKGTNQSQ
jgi:hypothetical protein